MLDKVVTLLIFSTDVYLKDKKDVLSKNKTDYSLGLSCIEECHVFILVVYCCIKIGLIKFPFFHLTHTVIFSPFYSKNLKSMRLDYKPTV